MITKANEPIYKRADGYFVLLVDGLPYGVRPGDEECSYPYSEVASYLLDHPEALVPEPTPPAPTPEQLKEREIAEKLAYLASTDWYVVRFAETGVAIPAEVSAGRAAARARIDELQ